MNSPRIIMLASSAEAAQAAKAKLQILVDVDVDVEVIEDVSRHPELLRSPQAQTLADAVAQLAIEAGPRCVSSCFAIDQASREFISAKAGHYRQRTPRR